MGRTDAMARSTAEDPIPGSPARRRRLNLALFLLLVVLAILYGHLHLRGWVNGLYLAGGTVSLALLWQIVSWTVTTFTDVDLKALARELLRRPGATRLLAAGLLLLALLYAVTSSIYAVYQPGAPAARYRIAVLRHGESYLGPLEVSAERPVAGRPFFFGGSRRLEVRLEQPADFQPLTRTVRAWSAARIAVPGAFTPRHLTVLRLVPGLTLKNELPAPADEPEVRYELWATVGHKLAEPLRDLRRQTVYLGAPAADLERLAEGHDRDAFERFLDGYLSDAGVPDAARGGLKSQWQRAPQLLPTAEAGTGDAVELELRRIYPDRREECVARATVTLAGDDRIQSYVLEKGGC